MLTNHLPPEVPENPDHFLVSGGTAGRRVTASRLGSMHLVIASACIGMGMTPAATLVGGTLGVALAPGAGRRIAAAETVATATNGERRARVKPMRR